MSFRILCLLLWLLLCTSSLAIYFALQPSPGLIAATLACLLLFQLAYFGSVLLLVCLAAIAQLSQRLPILVFTARPATTTPSKDFNVGRAAHQEAPSTAEYHSHSELVRLTTRTSSG